MTKLIDGGWFPLLMAGVIAFLMLTWRTGRQLLEHQGSKLRQLGARPRNEKWLDAGRRV